MGKVTSQGVKIYDNYLNQEIDTGKKWIDGKTIYRKVIYFGTLPNAGLKNVKHNISKLDWIVNVMINARNSSGNILSIPYLYPRNSYDTYYITFEGANETNISIVTGADRSDYDAYVILEYTKK